MKWGSYTIHTEIRTLDTDSEHTSKNGHIEIWQNGKDTIYSIRGNLPEHVNRKLAEIAEERGYLYWYNCGKYTDVVL